MSSGAVITALRQALDADPRNGTLWLHLAELQQAGGHVDDALVSLRAALELPDVRGAAGRRLVRLLRRAGQLAEALLRAESLLEQRDDPELRHELAQVLAARGDDEGAAEQRARVAALRPDLLDQPDEEPLFVAGTELAGGASPPSGSAPTDEPTAADTGADTSDGQPAAAAVSGDDGDLTDWASQFDWGDLRVTFDDVAGLEEVKSQIRLRIIAPFQQPEIYQAFGRSGGGGLMLYGPPGCGKTYVARATAGELGARFVSVSIHEVVDKYWGDSEKLVHALFEDARRSSPTVLFFDEFDALGSSRGRGESQFWKTLVDQLLQEMDGVGARNRDVLLMAATNTPWNVDAAFRRPGRFDRVLFVTPPDERARAAILRSSVAKLPGGEAVDVAGLARATPLFTGADLVALAERAGEEALSRSLSSGTVHAVEPRHFDRALSSMSSSAEEWFATARNHARYANEGGQYDELVKYLKSIRKW